MGTRFLDIDGDRELVIDAGDERRPNSVYIFGPQGLAIEFDRMVFYMAVALELGLTEEDTLVGRISSDSAVAA
jgi:hypothetical protein